MPDKERTVVRLALTGSLTVTDKAALDACLDKYARLFAALGLWERQTDIAVVPGRRRVRRSRHRRVRRRRRRRTGRHGALRRRGRRRRTGGAGAAAASGGPRCRMKLHRLVLTNYRGITHREIEFPDRGVVVVSGANEIGKSSMIEALDLLLEAKDRSTKKEVKQVKPTHADVGAEITAEISTGPYRFVYRKRFHKRVRDRADGAGAASRAADRRRGPRPGPGDAGTRPSTCSCGGRSACCRRRRRRPWTCRGATRCRARSTSPPVRRSQLSGAEPLLIDRIDAEYLRLLHARPAARQASGPPRRTGCETPTKRWRGARRRSRRSTKRCGQHAALTAELEPARRRARGGGQAAGHRSDRRRGGRRADTQQLKQAEVVAAAADATLAAPRCLRSPSGAGCGPTSTSAPRPSPSWRPRRHEAARGRADRPARYRRPPRTAAELARAAVQASQARVDAARRAVDQLSDRDEADRLASRLAKIDAAQREVERRRARTRGHRADRTRSMRDIETAAAAVERATGQAELASAHIEVVAVADIELRVGGEPIALDAGEHLDGERHDDDRHRRTGRADRARGPGCARFADPGQARCRTTGSDGGADGCPSRRRRGGARPRPAAPRTGRYPRQVDRDGPRPHR